MYQSKFKKRVIELFSTQNPFPAPSAVELQAIAKACDGDIRNAVNMLQVSCLKTPLTQGIITMNHKGCEYKILWMWIFSAYSTRSFLMDYNFHPKGSTARTADAVAAVKRKRSSASFVYIMTPYSAAMSDILIIR